MSDTTVLEAVFFVTITLWGLVLFLIGSKEQDGDYRSSRWRRIARSTSVAMFVAILVVLAIAAVEHATIQHNQAVRESVVLAQSSFVVRTLLGDPIRYGGDLKYGRYEGIGTGIRIIAGVNLQGSRQSATLNICAIRQDDLWTPLFVDLTTPDGKNTVQLKGTAGMKPCAAR